MVNCFVQLKKLAHVSELCCGGEENDHCEDSQCVEKRPPPRLKCSVCSLGLDSLADLIDHKDTDVVCRYGMEIGSNRSASAAITAQPHCSANNDLLSTDECGFNFELDDGDESMNATTAAVSNQTETNGIKKHDKNSTKAARISSHEKLPKQQRPIVELSGGEQLNDDANGNADVKKRRKYTKHRANGNLICESMLFLFFG
jgi:hypothetical protein